MRWCILLLGITSVVQAQESGFIPDDEAFDSTALVASIPQEERGNIPQVFSLQDYCPDAGNQGNLPSCVAWSLSNALTIQHAYQQRHNTAYLIENRRYSVAYIYNQIMYSGKCYGGAKYTDGLQLLVDKGSCNANLLPYSYDCQPTPTDRHHNAARSYRINRYYRVFNQSTPSDDKIDLVVDQIGIKRRPVLVAMQVPANFRNQPPELNATWTPVDGHAMVAIGYDLINNTITFLNSYGPQWGRNGFFKMDLDVFGEHVLYGFVMEISAN